MGQLLDWSLDPSKTLLNWSLLHMIQTQHSSWRRSCSSSQLCSSILERVPSSLIEEKKLSLLLFCGRFACLRSRSLSSFWSWSWLDCFCWSSLFSSLASEQWDQAVSKIDQAIILPSIKVSNDLVESVIDGLWSTSQALAWEVIEDSSHQSCCSLMSSLPLFGFDSFSDS